MSRRPARRALLVLLLVLLAPGPAARAQDEGAPSELEAAVTLLDSGAVAEAAARLAPLTQAEGLPGIAARYHFAKALYRLGHLHAALTELDRVLAAGRETRYFAAALEWCLFIGRKMEDDVAVNRVLSRYEDAPPPPKYRDEFLFRLARYHYRRALVADRQADAPAPPPPPPDDEEGISFEADPFAEAPPPEGGDEGGISFEDDPFGEAAAPPSVAEGLGAEAHREAARRLVLRVAPDSRYGARAKFVEGLLLVTDRRDNDALAAFKAVVEATRDPAEGERDVERRRRERLRELAFFQLARLHFGAQQPSFSIFYYRKVDRDSPEWLDALYEESWAEYRLGRHERALGNLLTVNAPFFEDTYFPESLILKAVIYYENCRYEEAGTIIGDFLERFEPVLERLRRMASESRTPEGWYEVLAEMRQQAEEAPAGDGQVQVARVLALALSDPELRRLTGAIEAVSAEMAALERAASSPPLSSVARMADLRASLDATRAELRAEAGRAMERKLRFEAAAVRTLISQALRVRVETARAEEGRLEASLGRRRQRPKQVDREVEDFTDDEKVVWPFEGEYWRDELGTYELSLARTCL